MTDPTAQWPPAAANAGDMTVRTIAVVNRKGGSGKTTTAVSLAAALVQRGFPTLLIDLDPQASASAWLGRTSNDRGLFDALAGTRNLGDVAMKTRIPGLAIVHSSAWLVQAERTLKGDISLSVARAIQRLKPEWSFVIIDCPPSLSYLSVGALMGVGEAIIPVEAHAIALPGVAAVVREIARIQSSFNPVLRDPLIVACRVNRTTHARQVVAELDRAYGWLLARATIRDTIRLAEAEAARQPITTYAPECGASGDYGLLADELIERGTWYATRPQQLPRWRRWVARSLRIAAVSRRAV